MTDLECGYDQMAGKFSGTRTFFWPDLAFIADYIENNDKVLDYGCGNGRLLEVLKGKKINYTGVDVSRKLIELAREKYPEYCQAFLKAASQGSLAFPADFFNKVISIAVFHHFPRDYAEKAAKELYRVTKPNGVVIITVWNLWQKKHWKHIFNPTALFNKTFQLGNYAGLGLRDIFVPFRNNQGEVFSRYHRVYTRGELVNIFLAAGFRIENCFLVNNKNIVLIATK